PYSRTRASPIATAALVSNSPGSSCPSHAGAECMRIPTTTSIAYISFSQSLCRFSSVLRGPRRRLINLPLQEKPKRSELLLCYWRGGPIYDEGGSASQSLGRPIVLFR